MTTLPGYAPSSAESSHPSRTETGSPTVARRRLSGRALRNLGLALALATGAFWTVMPNDGPRTAAADPSSPLEVFSPYALKAAADIPSGEYAAH